MSQKQPEAASQVVEETAKTVFANLSEAENAQILNFMRAKKKNMGDDLIKAWTSVIKAKCVADNLAPFGSLGDSPQPAARTLVVLQREVGHLRSHAKADGSSKATIKHIASVDATSCLIVGLRTNLVTTVAHFDEAGVVTPGVEDMMQWMMEVHRMAGSLPRKVEEGSGEKQEVLTFELYVVGGAVEYKHSLPTLVSLLFTMLQMQKRQGIRVNLNCAGCCFWDLNTTEERSIRHRGLSINVEDGTAYPMEVLGKKRLQTYPQPYLRTLACFSDDRKNVLSWVTPKMSADAKGDVVGDVYPSYKGDHAEDVVVVIRPFGWNTFSDQLVRLPRAEFLNWSTTPTMEASDFPEMMRASLIFANTQTPGALFGADYSDMMLYRYSLDKDEWVRLEFIEEEGAPAVPVIQGVSGVNKSANPHGHSSPTVQEPEASKVEEIIE